MVMRIKRLSTIAHVDQDQAAPDATIANQKRFKNEKSKIVSNNCVSQKAATGGSSV